MDRFGTHKAVSKLVREERDANDALSSATNAITGALSAAALAAVVLNPLEYTPYAGLAAGTAAGSFALNQWLNERSEQRIQMLISQTDTNALDVKE